MNNKFIPQTPDDVDLARFAFGAYQGLDGSKPARIEFLKYKDGSIVALLFGKITPCEFGDQCEAHARYCNYKDGPRKCHYGAYSHTGESIDRCPFFKPNPLFKGTLYFGHEWNYMFLTVAALVLEDKADIEWEDVDADASSRHKGQRDDIRLGVEEV